MTLLDLFLRLCFAGFSLILFAVSVLAYRRYRERRLGFVMVAFLIYAFASLLVLLSDFISLKEFSMSAGLVALNLGILVFLYLALLER